MRRPLPTFAIILCLALGLVSPAAARERDKPKKEAAEEESPWSSETFSGLQLRSIGPAFMSGRIADLAIDPRRQSTWYVAVGSGGVWKTTNAGTTWKAIFEDQSSYSIGDVTIDPNDPDIVWVGTGENVAGRHVGFGDGVYKSLDGGASWENVGLGDSEHIGRIVVHPERSDTVWVAAEGPLWSGGGDRGLYKTTDGGESWEKVLGGGEFTGVVDVVMDPRDPDVLYAATHQRLRTVAALIDGGPESGIHKSIDGGATWRELTSGLPEEDMGKIGLAVSPQRPDVVYATIELAHRKGGFYRSSDGGGTWEKRSDYLSGGTGPHYYQEIFADPHHFDRVYQMDVWLNVTDDGGKTFRRANEDAKHSDNHALAFDPDDPDYLMVGSDGGLYESWDQGASWKFVTNLPVTQFYKIAVDDDRPFYNIYGGTQDNSTQGGPSRTRSVNGIANSDWFITLFADGHQPAVDPSNPDIVYSEWQQGNLVRYDRKTGEMVYLQPQGEPGDPAERWNWDSPILISPHDPARLYYASQRIWRSDDRGDSWRPISPDLSRGQDRLTLPMMGRVWSYDAIWDLWAMSFYGNVTSLAESPRVEGLLYAGTDDGLVQVSEDGGGSWRRAAALPGVPEGSFVNDIKADRVNPDTVYVALDNHKQGDFAPYLLRSEDRGRSWRSIAGDLPDRHLVWRLVQDPVDPALLFVGTELGVFFSRDGGKRWVELTGGVPTIPFRDLAIQEREVDLVAGTFGRGIFILDDYSPLRGLGESDLDRESILFPVKDAWWYVPTRPFGQPGKGSQGDAFFLAENPPFGAIFTYYLRDGFETLEAARKRREKELAEAGKDTPTPGWEALRAEAREQEPAIVLTVRDAAGEVVRRIEGPVTKGFHRVAWDLCRPPSTAWTAEEQEDWFGSGGWMVAPGEYTVSFGQRIDGTTTEIGEPVAFSVVPLSDERAIAGADPAARTAFVRQIDQLERAVTGALELTSDTDRRLGAIHSVLASSTADPDLLRRTIELEERLADIEMRLGGDPLLAGLGEPEPASILERLGKVELSNRFSTYGPTTTDRRRVELATSEYQQIRRQLGDLVERQLPALEAELDAAGVPWTPGRPLPPLE